MDPQDDKTTAGAATQAHYERHPYPSNAVLDWSPHALSQAGLALGRPLPNNGRILIAGCGTTEAVRWALAAPSAEVTGIDFSARSLAMAQTSAERLALDNVRLLQRDIMSLSPEDAELGGPFDLIVSFGVVHHLSDPAAGLARLTPLLTPEGALQLMVYSTTHRYLIRQLERVAERLTKGAEGDARVAALIDLAREAEGFPSPLREQLEMVLEQAAEDPPALHDTFGHPNWFTYTIDELWELLAAAGLRFGAWAKPGEWQAETYLDEDGPTARRLRALEPKARYDVIDKVFAPLLILWAERAELPPSISVFEQRDDAFLDLTLRPAHRVRITFDEAGQPGEPVPYGPTVDMAGDDARVSFLPGSSYVDHKLMIPILQRLDGQRDLREVAEAVAADTGAPLRAVETLAARVARALLSPHEAVVCVG